MRRVAIVVAILLACPLASPANDGPMPHRAFAESRFAVDAILARPYDGEIPLGSTGDRLWATSPQGWGFGDGVHWVYLSDLRALDLEVSDELGRLLPAKATYRPSHVALEGAARKLSASASFTFRPAEVVEPFSRPFTPDRRWTCWSSGRRDDWYAVDLGSSRTLTGLKVWFFDDTGAGACRPPESFEVQRWDGRAWATIPATTRAPARPGEGENVVTFPPTTTGRVRLLLHHAGKDFYTGIYGFEPIADGPSPASPLTLTGGKFIRADDVLVATLTATNPTDKPAKLRVVPTCDWQGSGRVEAIHYRIPGSTGGTPEQALSGSWATRLHGFDVREDLRFATTTPRGGEPIGISGSTVAEKGIGDLGFGQAILHAEDGRFDDGFVHLLAPGESRTWTAGLSIRRPGEPDPLPKLIPLPTGREVQAAGWRTPDLLVNQVRDYQGWYDANLPYFDCSDPAVAKLYYHRAYNLRKNLIDPKLGRLSRPTQAEGHWHNGWYANVISYGAGHQVREARWLRDPKYWTGHLKTWAENERPDGVFPNDIKPDGPDKGQYADWISSTAWEGHLVHPDKKFLAGVVDKLAANVRGWQKVYDPDGDGLLRVDDHWWTGMEWQPSFFADSGYKTNPGDTSQPTKRVDLERVDLTAYQFGNATNVARVYRALGKQAEAKEFEALAAKIAGAVRATMWDGEAKFFYSARAEGKTRVAVKEVIGVYPFFFGMLPTGNGYESAWASIVDPAEFWTPWPVASVSKKCPAYSQDGWLFPSSRGSGCMWNGPTWPHANSIVLTGMANTLRANRGRAIPLEARHYWELFRSFTRAQYRGQDLTYPWTGEFYDGETARWKTTERDYNHSTWIDLLVTDVVGLVPRDDGVIEIDPVIPPGAPDHFVLDGLHYRGHDLAIVWDAAGGVDVHRDGRTGLDLLVDGKVVASSPTFGRIVHDPARKVGLSPELPGLIIGERSATGPAR